MKWYKVPGVVHTNQPFIKKVSEGGHTLCLVGYQGKIYALSARCPHAGGDLARGWCDEGKLVCPVHRFSYNLESGRGSSGQNDYVDTYAVKIEGNDIYIGFSTFIEKLKSMFK